jgi:hypothetical protein
MTNRKSTRAAPKPKNKASKADQLKSLLAKPDGMTAEALATVLSEEFEPVSVFRGQAGLRQRSTRAIREERRRVAI